MPITVVFETQVVSGSRVFESQIPHNQGDMVGRPSVSSSQGGYIIYDRGSGEDWVVAPVLETGVNNYFAPGARVGSGNLVPKAFLDGVGQTQSLTTSTGAGALQGRSLLASTGNVYTTDTPTGSGDLIGGANLLSIAATVHAGRYLLLIVRDKFGNPQPNLSGISWSWFDESFPHDFTSPTDKGSNATTDGAGLMLIDLPHSTLSPGGVGWLNATNSNGTPNQYPPALSISKPFLVN